MKKFRLFNMKLSKLYCLIKENIYSCATEKIVISDNTFHHKLDIKDVTSILEYGLLSRRLKCELVDKREITEYEISVYSEEWHANGIDHVSIANVNEKDNQVDKDVCVWNIYSGFFPDIIISSQVPVKKNSNNYLNEYLVENKISTELFNSIDLRIFKIIDSPKLSNRKKIKLLLQYYQNMRNIAFYLVENNLSIPLRETSEVNNKDEYDKAITLDPYKIIKLPILK